MRKGVKRFFKNQKGDVDIDTLIDVLITVAIIVILGFVIFILKGNGTQLITQIKNLLRIG
jgi:Flp pilus assembly pilin Flp